MSVEWWDWAGLPVTEAEREQHAATLVHVVTTGETPNANFTLTGDMMVVAVADVDGASVDVYDCRVLRRGRVLP